MYETLSSVQEEKFLDISGEKYDPYREGRVYLRGLEAGSFMTKRPYNDPDWKLSPWRFTFLLEYETGYFVCELAHKMTNDRAYGWDQDGNELPEEILSRFFHLDGLVVED